MIIKFVGRTHARLFPRGSFGRLDSAKRAELKVALDDRGTPDGLIVGVVMTHAKARLVEIDEFFGTLVVDTIEVDGVSVKIIWAWTRVQISLGTMDVKLHVAPTSGARRTYTVTDEAALVIFPMIADPTDAEALEVMTSFRPTTGDELAVE